MSDIVERIHAKKRNATDEEDDAAEEIERLRQQLTERERLLTESQAREKVLRDALDEVRLTDAYNYGFAETILNPKEDSTALDTMLAQHLANAKREVFLEAADEFDKSMWLECCGGFNFAKHLRRMADELKGGEQ